MSAYKSNNHKDYEEYTTGRGEIIKIHAVPQPIIRAVTPARPAPVAPTVDMQLPGKAVQKRPMKQGDAGWESFQRDLQDYEEERDALQEAITFSLALKSYTFPAELKLSEDIQGLIDAGLLKKPDNQYLLKMMWIRENVLGQHDEYNVNMLIQKLSGVPEDIIDEMKRNFRDLLLGKTNRSVGTATDEPAATSQEDSAE